MLGKLKQLLGFKNASQNRIARISMSVDSFNFDSGPSIIPPTEFDQNLLDKKISLILDCLKEAKTRAENIISELEAQDKTTEALTAIHIAAENVRLGGLKVLAGETFKLKYLDDHINLQLPDLSIIETEEEANQKLNHLLKEIEASEHKLASYLTRCEITENNRSSAAIDMRQFEDFMNNS